MSEERSKDTVWHDEIEIGKWRKIAARGLTPNHYRHQFKGGGVEGRIVAFEHFGKSTVVTIQVINRETGGLSRSLAEVDLAHLDEIEVEY